MMQFLFWLPHCSVSSDNKMLREWIIFFFCPSSCQNLTEGLVFYSYCGIFRSLENRGFYFLFCFDIGHFDNGFGSNTEISTLAKQNNICSHLAPMQHPLSGIDRKQLQLGGLRWLSHSFCTDYPVTRIQGNGGAVGSLLARFQQQELTLPSVVSYFSTPFHSHYHTSSRFLDSDFCSVEHPQSQQTAKFPKRFTVHEQFN